MKETPVTLKIFTAIIALVLLSSAGVFLWLKMVPQAEPPLPVYKQVPYFSFTDQRRQAIGIKEMGDHIWIANFVFTRCAGPCPILTSHMSDLQTALMHAEDVKLVSFSVDPEFDTPEVLTAYAAQYDAHPDKWFFLTGDKGELYQFIGTNLNMTLQASTETAPIIHTTYFMLVDKKGGIRGYYNSNEPDFKSRLLLDAERLRQEEG